MLNINTEFEIMKTNLFIVGAMKAGTTALYESLIKNPRVEGGEIKEPNFFAKDFIDYECFDRKYKEHSIGVGSGNEHIAYLGDINEYVNNYAKVDVLETDYLIDASVSYLYFKESAKLLQLYNDSSKIIICLREPVARAFSHYKMDVAIGREKKGFEESFIADKALRELNWGQKSFYYECGLYYDAVKEFIDVFGTENVVVVLQDKLKSKPSDVEDDLTAFLGFKVELINENNNETLEPNFKYINYFIQMGGIKSFLKRIVPGSIKLKLKKWYYSKPKKECELELFKYLYRDDVSKLATLLSIDLLALWGYKDRNE